MKRAIFNIIFVIFIAIIVVNVFRKCFGTQNYLNLDSFLDSLTHIEQHRFSFDISSFQITSDWGIFNGLREVVNALATVLGVIIWLCANLLNLILFLFQPIRLLFV